VEIELNLKTDKKTENRKNLNFLAAEEEIRDKDKER
jgi:hypothetical protein